MEIELKIIVCETIDLRKGDLHDISKKIWENPELGYKEFVAHDLLTTFLEKEEFKVLKKTPLETSFIARYGNPGGLKIGVLCEYDALPGIGHACGHNLIAEAGIGAALAIKSALMANPNIEAELIVYGTPAEELVGGKILMIKKGVFDEVDLCMMSHPTPYEIPTPIWLAATTIEVKFTGKASHTAALPWEGVNALDAAISFYNSVAMLRQQLKPTSRVHCKFINGGSAINVIPDSSHIKFGMRGLLDSDVLDIRNKIKKCAEGAAMATGSSVEFIDNTFISAVKTNEILIDLYIENAKSIGVEFNDDANKLLATTDMGNVSQIKPSIHPLFKIKSDSTNHTHGFTKATGADENQLPTLNSAKSMAMTAIDVICKPELLKEIRADFFK